MKSFCHGSAFARVAIGSQLPNIGQRSLVDAWYWPVIQGVVDAITRHGEDQEFSIFLRGSLVIGRAVRPFSDIDIVVISASRIKCIDELTKQVGELSANTDGVDLIDVQFVSEAEFFESERLAALRFNTQFQSVCLFGSEKILDRGRQCATPRFHATVYPHLWQEIDELQTLILQNKTVWYAGRERGMDFLCRWTARLLLRSLCLRCFEFSGYLTLDLEGCASIIRSYMPHVSDFSGVIAQYERSPSNDKKNIMRMISQGKSILRLSSW